MRRTSADFVSSREIMRQVDSRTARMILRLSRFYFELFLFLHSSIFWEIANSSRCTKRPKFSYLGTRETCRLAIPNVLRGFSPRIPTRECIECIMQNGSLISVNPRIRVAVDKTRGGGRLRGMLDIRNFLMSIGFGMNNGGRSVKARKSGIF